MIQAKLYLNVTTQKRQTENKIVKYFHKSHAVVKNQPRSSSYNILRDSLHFLLLKFFQQSLSFLAAFQVLTRFTLLFYHCNQILH